MDKVKITREAGEALDRIKEVSQGNTEEMYLRLGSILYNQAAIIEDKEFFRPLYKCKAPDLFNALQYGYEVEQTPQENLKAIYDKVSKKCREPEDELDDRTYHDGFQQGIFTTLEVLKIKVSGVNDQ